MLIDPNNSRASTVIALILPRINMVSSGQISFSEFNAPFVLIRLPLALC